MKCDRCDKPAVVHELTVRNGKKQEVHLCEEHALEAGVSVPMSQPINELLTQFVASKSAKPSRSKRLTCEHCGMTFAEVRQHGTLGCPHCYEAFARHLEPMIERAQSGATHHTGKSPRRAGSSIDNQLQIRRLVKELDCAVAAEQYERAAQLRDRLRNLEIDVVSRDDPQAATESRREE